MNINTSSSQMTNYTNPMTSHVAEDVIELQSSIGRLDTIVCALWEALIESGVSEETLHEKIRDAIENKDKYVRPSYEPVIAKCPNCGKAVQGSRKNPLLGKCFFCGGQVYFYPYTDKTSADRKQDDGNDL